MECSEIRGIFVALSLFPLWIDVFLSACGADALERGSAIPVRRFRRAEPLEWSMKKSFRSSGGQIAVLYAGILFVLVGAIALGTDVAVMYMNWQHAQKVADAAAMAGSNFLTGIAFSGTVDSRCTGQPDSASKAACTYAVGNGLAASTLTISEPTSSIVKVVAQQSGLPYYFGKVVGLDTYTVSATAAAQASGPPTTCNDCKMVPLGLQCDAPCTDASGLVAGEPVSFGNKFISSTINLPGNWQWMDTDGSDGATLEANLTSGSPSSFTLGQTIYTDPGVKTGPVTHALSSRFSGCPTIADPCSGGNPNNIPAGDPCLVIVPVVDFSATKKGGTTSVTIEAFAEVYLDPATTDAKHINGCFVSAVVGNTIAGSAGSTPRALGPTAPPRLTE